jgi:dTDP-4-dehydrorhamnose 3,5-epimerase
MNIKKGPIDGILMIEHQVWKDDRGSFLETFNESSFEASGLPIDFVQDNQSISKLGVIRGLHAQSGAHAQGKLIRVVKGRVLDVVVDIRKDAPTFGQHAGFYLSEEEAVSVWIPPGFLHGFISLAEGTLFSYKVTGKYDPSKEIGVRYDDPQLSIQWPTLPTPYLLSEKDLKLPLFRDLDLLNS